MHDVLIITNTKDYSYALLPYFLKYKIKEEDESVAEPFYIGKIDKAAVTGVFSFIYNGINITIKFEEHIDYSRVGIREHIKNISKNYDKIFVLREYNSRNLDIESFNNVEILYFKVDENYHESQSYIEDFLSKFRIISSASINFKHLNFYHEPIINLFAFYYQFGFNHVSFNKLNVDKQNLMGLYYIPKYKNVRDIMYNEMCDIFKNNELDSPTIYDTNVDKPQLIAKYLELNNGNWGLNHAAMYSDYLSSVCAFIFDTLNHVSVQGPADGTNRYYINEKALKAIMFSKLNIPFIIDTNPHNLHILNDLGFWFLNSEFHTFNKTKTESQMIKETRDSIIKSIDYLIDIYKKNDCNLNDTHTELVKLYESKMQNNYNTFIKYLSEPKDGDKLLNFILYGNGN
jgi:hypothetical protein